MQRHSFMLVKRLVQLQFVEIKLTRYKLCFISLKSNGIMKTYFIWRNVNVKILLTWKGFCNLDKTLDLDFDCLKCLVLMYQSIPSPAIPSGTFLKGRMPPPSTKKVRNPDPWSREIVLKRHPRGIYFQKFSKKPQNIKQKS